MTRTSAILPLRLLLISRDFGLISEACNAAQPMKIFCEICSDGQAALRRLCKSKFEAVLIDYKVEQDARRIITAVQNSTSHRSAVTFAVVEGSQKPEATRAGFHFVLSRPVDFKNLRRTIRTAFPLLVQERRRYFRAAIAVPITLQSAACERVVGATVDISEGGMAVECDASLPLDTKVVAEFRMPGVPQNIQLNARVCWIKGKLAGLQFEQLPVDILEIVKSWLTQRLEEAIPELNAMNVG